MASLPRTLVMPEAAKRSAGWTTVAFGDVVRLSTERSSDPEADGFERFVGLDHIEPGELRIRRWGGVADGTTFTSVFRPGQVLFGKRRAYQRKVAVADFSGVCSGDIYVLESKGKDLLPELLPFICQTDAFFEHAVGTSAGSLSPRTNWTSLASFEFTLPPVPEQRRASKLLTAFKLAVQTFQQVADSTDVTRKALLRSAFESGSGRSTKPRPFREASEVGDVQLGQQRHPKYLSGDNIRPYLRVANVYDGRIDFSDVETMHFPVGELRKFELKVGDVLLNEGQSLELVGRSAVYKGEMPGACFQKTLVRFRCGPDILPEYAHAFFQHCLYAGIFARIAVQTTSVAHLTAVRFKKLLIPMPSLAEQQMICARLRQLETGAAISRARINELREALRLASRELLETP
jgi:type I restriction enzyme, S subunit